MRQNRGIKIGSDVENCARNNFFWGDVVGETYKKHRLRNRKKKKNPPGKGKKKKKEKK